MEHLALDIDVLKRAAEVLCQAGETDLALELQRVIDSAQKASGRG